MAETEEILTLELFLNIGLSEKKAKEVLRNEKIVDCIKQIIKIVSATANNSILKYENTRPVRSLCDNFKVVLINSQFVTIYIIFQIHGIMFRHLIILNKRIHCCTYCITRFNIL